MAGFVRRGYERGACRNLNTCSALLLSHGNYSCVVYLYTCILFLSMPTQYTCTCIGLVCTHSLLPRSVVVSSYYAAYLSWQRQFFKWCFHSVEDRS